MIKANEQRASRNSVLARKLRPSEYLENPDPKNSDCCCVENSYPKNKTKPCLPPVTPIAYRSSIRCWHRLNLQREGKKKEIKKKKKKNGQRCWIAVSRRARLYLPTQKKKKKNNAKKWFAYGGCACSTSGSETGLSYQNDKIRVSFFAANKK